MKYKPKARWGVQRGNVIEIWISREHAEWMVRRERSARRQARLVSFKPERLIKRARPAPGSEARDG